MGAIKYIKQTLTELKGEVNNSMINSWRLQYPTLKNAWITQADN